MYILAFVVNNQFDSRRTITRRLDMSRLDEDAAEDANDEHTQEDNCRVCPSTLWHIVDWPILRKSLKTRLSVNHFLDHLRYECVYELNVIQILVFKCVYNI